MPLPTTFAGDSARGEGLFASTISLGSGYWAATLTDAYTTPFTVGTGITTDLSGNVYVCGYGLNSSNQRIASVSKYNSSGTIQWQQTLTDAYSTPSDINNGITIDSSGNIYVCGNCLNSAGTRTAIVYKLNSSGTIQWQQTLTPTAGTSSTSSIALDSSNNVYVCGNAIASPNTVNLIYKLNSSGTIQWQKTITDSNTVKGRSISFSGITIDGSGNVYACGSNYNVSDLPVQLLCKYDSSGTIQWQRNLTDASTLAAGALAFTSFSKTTTDSSGNVYVCGQGYNSSNQLIASVAKYNSSGTIQWQQTLTDVYSTPNDFASGISIDSSGNVFVVGQGENSSNQFIIFISKYNSSGTIQWQRTITDTYTTPTDAGNNITIDSLGNLYVTGQITNTAGNPVMFITKLPSDGSRTGTYSNSTFGIVYASSSWTAATSTWTASTPSLTTATPTYTAAASSFTAATSTWTTSLVAL